LQKLLLVEDDIMLSETLQEYLESKGFQVDVVFSGEEALQKAYENNYDLLLLDVMVPGIDGFELLKKIRQNKETPAIFITSLNSVDAVEKGFKSGGDDYIRKPFALKELLLRIEALLKREFRTHQERIDLGNGTLFEPKEGVLYKDEKPINLNQKELRLLKLFLKHPNEVLSHEKIYDELWDYDETPSDMALRTYIKNLRKILGKEKIESIKKHGYKFLLQ